MQVCSMLKVWAKGSSVCACEVHSSDVPVCCDHPPVLCRVMQKCNQPQLLRVKRQVQERHTHKRRWEEEATDLQATIDQFRENMGHGQRNSVFSDNYLMCLHTSDVVMWNNLVQTQRAICMPETTTLHVLIYTSACVWTYIITSTDNIKVI